MEWSETIGIGAVYDLEHLVVLIEVLLGKGKNLNNFGAVALVDLGPIVHLDLLDILLTIFLLLGLLVFAR